MDLEVGTVLYGTSVVPTTHARPDCQTEEGSHGHTQEELKSAHKLLAHDSDTHEKGRRGRSAAISMFFISTCHANDARGAIGVLTRLPEAS